MKTGERLCPLYLVSRPSSPVLDARMQKRFHVFTMGSMTSGSPSAKCQSVAGCRKDSAANEAYRVHTFSCHVLLAIRLESVGMSTSLLIFLTFPPKILRATLHPTMMRREPFAFKGCGMHEVACEVESNGNGNAGD